LIPPTHPDAGILLLVCHAVAMNAMRTAQQDRLDGDGSRPDTPQSGFGDLVDHRSGLQRQHRLPDTGGVRGQSAVQPRRQGWGVAGLQDLDVEDVELVHHRKIDGLPGRGPQIGHKGQSDITNGSSPRGAFTQIESRSPQSQSPVDALQKTQSDHLGDKARRSGLRQTAPPSNLVDPQQFIARAAGIQDSGQSIQRAARGRAVLPQRRFPTVRLSETHGSSVPNSVCRH
jgi:hypothetical protein